MQVRFYSNYSRVRLGIHNAGRMLFYVLMLMGGLLLTESSFAENWRSDEKVLHILGDRLDTAMAQGRLTRDNSLAFAEVCILHLRRHVEGERHLTGHQLANLLIWISRVKFNDAALYLEQLLVDDITPDQRRRVMEAIRRSMQEPTRVSAHTSVEEMQQALVAGKLQTQEARIALAFALAESGNEYGIDHLRDKLMNPLSSHEIRVRIALTAVEANLPIPEAFEYCEGMLTRDEVLFSSKVAAANRLMQYGVGEAVEWAERALEFATDEHQVLLLKGLVMNGHVRYFADLVEFLGSESEFVVYQARDYIATLVGDDKDWVGDIRRTSPEDLKTQLKGLIEAKGDRLRWDAKKERLILAED